MALKNKIIKYPDPHWAPCVPWSRGTGVPVYKILQFEEKKIVKRMNFFFTSWHTKDWRKKLLVKLEAWHYDVGKLHFRLIGQVSVFHHFRLSPRRFGLLLTPWSGFASFMRIRIYIIASKLLELKKSRRPSCLIWEGSWCRGAAASCTPAGSAGLHTQWSSYKITTSLKIINQSGEWRTFSLIGI